MNLETITMEKDEAQEAFREYRAAVTGGAHKKLGEARREYERLDRAVMRGYKELAKGNALLELSKAIAMGGETDVHFTDRWSGEESTHRFPAIAVCRADAARCLSTGINSSGGVTFYADVRWTRARKNVVRVPDATFERQTGSEWASAIVPTVPPPFRPAYSLSNYHILWEAEWTGAAPVDPALLKHLGGDLYAVLAVWDLTPLEQAVLAGRSE